MTFGTSGGAVGDQAERALPIPPVRNTTARADQVKEDRLHSPEAPPPLPVPPPPEDELRWLIAEQQRDAASYRVFGLSVDQFAAGADVALERRRGTAHDDRHGTLGCYVRLRCRCAKCRAVSAAYARDRRRRTPLIACGCGALTRRGRCLSCAMRDVWAVRAA